MLWYFPGTFTDLCLGVVWCALVDIDMDIASLWFRVIARQNGLLLMPRAGGINTLTVKEFDSSLFPLGISKSKTGFTS